MSIPTGESLAIVVAMTNPATLNFVVSLARFAEEVGPTGEVILVVASGCSESIELGSGFPNVRVVSRPAGRLAPLLWRDGLGSTAASLVALTTAQMIPHPGWLASLVSRIQETDAAGVGGPIEPGSDLNSTDRAVALLRYSSYFPPLPLSSAAHPPGDNALYRRERLMEVESAWLDGFWEVEVHKALHDRGEILAMDPSAIVTFEGGVGLFSMLVQRYRHARRYGIGRSIGLSTTARLSRILASPLVPLLLALRIVRALRSRQNRLTHWLLSFPALLVLASAWALGEAVGTWQGEVTLSNNQRHDLVTQLTGKAR